MYGIAPSASTHTRSDSSIRQEVLPLSLPPVGTPLPITPPFLPAPPPPRSRSPSPTHPLRSRLPHRSTSTRWPAISGTFSCSISHYKPSLTFPMAWPDLLPSPWRTYRAASLRTNPCPSPHLSTRSMRRPTTPSIRRHPGSLTALIPPIYLTGDPLLPLACGPLATRKERRRRHLPSFGRP